MGDTPEEIQERIDRFFALARMNSLELRQRFVPQPTTGQLWCVVDAQAETIIDSGLEFGVAFSRARDLSELDKHTHQ